MSNHLSKHVYLIKHTTNHLFCHNHWLDISWKWSFSNTVTDRIAIILYHHTTWPSYIPVRLLILLRTKSDINRKRSKWSVFFLETFHDSLCWMMQAYFCKISNLLVFHIVHHSSDTTHTPSYCWRVTRPFPLMWSFIHGADELYYSVQGWKCYRGGLCPQK